MPAAGVGSRMGGDVPKQYLQLTGVPVIQRSLEALLHWEPLQAVVVALSRSDNRWPTLPVARDSRVIAVVGGAERSDSVLAGLRALSGRAARSDWVLVHDAARPCLGREELTRLTEALADDPVGGLLAVPVSETVKRADPDDRVAETVPREHLWLAQTPQMFRYGLLCEALEDAAAAAVPVTDEAAALERQGSRPRLVVGSARNIKITRPDDLLLAERYLAMED
jgi:2-C-methyl-D-erythritol 4-phosphate cytidylyltransferase